MPGRVLALLPNAGLANKLFVWAKAEVFANLNDMTSDTLGWTWPKLGPFLRGERSTRMYGGYFRSRTGAGAMALATGALTRRLIFEPEIRGLEAGSMTKNRTYVFKDVPSWRDYFGDIRDHRDFVRDRLFSAIHDCYKQELETLRPPVVAIHIRCGDFRVLQPGEDFARVGGVRTPQRYFVDLIEQVRSICGSDVPVTIFSDGTDDEIAFLTHMPVVARSPAKSDILDLFLMAKAQIIITSAGSTFGEWAAFLSEAAVLRHPAHIHAPIRPKKYTDLYYEGPAPSGPQHWSSLLVSNVGNIRSR